MILNRIKNIFIIGFVLAICACGSHEPLILEGTTPVEETPERLKGNTDVYNSMARAIKYNINTTIYNIKNRIDHTAPQSSTKKIIQSVYNGDDTDIAAALRLLDFAVVFATNTVEPNPAIREEYLFEKSAQHLALAAIRAHEDVLFADKKIKLIDRDSRLETKEINALNNKLEKNGTLSDAEITHKKGLEVVLHNQQQLRNQLLGNITQYLRLVQSDEKKLDVEGRRFYELEDFDNKYTISTFQNVAASNRPELRYAKRQGYNNDYHSMLYHLMRNHPEMEHLQINGADLNDMPYIKGLVKRARKVSEKLIETTLTYQNAQTIEPLKKTTRDKVYQNLGDAIFTQVELAYNLVKQVSTQLTTLQENIAQQNKEIRNQEKNAKSNPEKITVMNLKNKLTMSQLQESKLIAERAAALRSLYFYSGFSPFSKILLDQKIKVISNNLKIAFNKDMIAMIANSPEPQPEPKTWEVKDEDWAKGENWLEQLVDENKQLGKNALDGHISEPKTSGQTNITTNTTPTDDSNQRKILQLGAYQKRESAELEWNMLHRIYPELQNHTPKIEETTINHQTWYRLYVESANGGWNNLCQRLKKDNFGCILR